MLRFLIARRSVHQNISIQLWKGWSPLKQVPIFEPETEYTVEPVLFMLKAEAENQMRLIAEEPTSKPSEWEHSVHAVNLAIEAA